MAGFDDNTDVNGTQGTTAPTSQSVPGTEEAEVIGAYVYDPESGTYVYRPASEFRAAAESQDAAPAEPDPVEPEDMASDAMMGMRPRAVGDFGRVPSGDPADSVLFQQVDEVQMLSESDHHRGILKRIVIIVTVFAVLLLAAVLSLVVYNAKTAEPDTTATVIDEKAADADASHHDVALSALPSMQPLFGLSQEDVTARVGSDYLLISTGKPNDEQKKAGAETVLVFMKLQGTDKATVSASAEGKNETVAQDGEAAEGEETPTEEPTPTPAPVEIADDPNQPHLTIGIDSHDMVCWTRYEADMNVLGFSPSSFADLVETKDTLIDILEAVGVEPAVGYLYHVPNPSDYATYGEGDVVEKEAFTFSGDIDSATMPTSWAVSYLYDHTGASDGASLSAVKRNLVITLS